MFIRRPRRDSVSVPTISPVGVVVTSALASLFLTSCVTPPPHPFTISPGYEEALSANTVLLLPLNVAISLPAELEESSRRVFRLIVEYLEGTGKSVETLSEYDASKLLARSASQLKQRSQVEENFDTLMSVVVEELRAKSQFDLVVVPNLVYRRASIYNGTNAAFWDGVKRPLGMSDQHGSSGSLTFTYSGSGKTDGISLYVLVYDTEGTRIFESYGGMDLLDYFEFVGLTVRQYRRDRLLVDVNAIQTGIELSFDPFVPMPVAEPSESR